MKKPQNKNLSEKPLIEIAAETADGPGIGMTFIVEPRELDTTIKVLSKHKFKGFMIGKVIKKSSSAITFI